MDWYHHAVHLLEFFVPAVSLTTHTVRHGNLVHYQANWKGAHRAISQRKSSYRRSSKDLR